MWKSKTQSMLAEFNFQALVNGLEKREVSDYYKERLLSISTILAGPNSEDVWFAELDLNLMKKKFIEILRSKNDLQFLSLDSFIRNVFNSNRLYVTMEDFMDIFSIFAVHPTDRRCRQEIKSVQFFGVTLFANKYMAYFMDKIINDPKFYEFAPSLVAAAIIFTARHYMELTPAWPLVLQQITGYNNQEILECAEMLKRTINEDIITNVIDNPCYLIKSNCCHAVCSPLSWSSRTFSDDSEYSSDSE